MNSLTKSFNSLLVSTIDNFATVAAEELNVDKEALLTIWNREACDEVKVTAAKAKKPAAAAAKKKTETSGSKCEYVKTKGASEGELCGCKVSTDSKSGKYCTRHLAQENPEKKAPAKKAGAKPTKAAEKKEASSEVLKTPLSSAKKAVRRNKFDNYEDPQTGFILDHTKTVIGRQNPDGTIDALTLEDIETCKRLQYNFKTPDNLTSKKDKDDDEEELEDEDEELEDEDEEEPED
jgi:hypothetical protein